MNAEERQRVTAAARELSTAGLWIDGSGELKAVELRQRSRQLVETRCISLIIIDDISLLRPGPLSAPDDKLPQEVGWMQNYLQTLARELGIALIACAPLARRIARFEHKTQGENTRIRDRTRGPTNVLFLCREESPQRRRTAIYPVFTKREHSGLVTHLILSQRMSDPFDSSAP
jgi:DnaB-like helicase C terminal domain